MINENIAPRELPGFTKKSFSMAFGGGEIWFEHLDGIYGYTELVLEKLEADYREFRRPSGTSLIAVNVDETELDENIIRSLAEKLCDGCKRFTRVVVVGADRDSQKQLKKALSGGGYALAFINDFEKAKMWLVSERL